MIRPCWAFLYLREKSFLSGNCSVLHHSHKDRTFSFFGEFCLLFASDDDWAVLSKLRKVWSSPRFCGISIIFTISILQITVFRKSYYNVILYKFKLYYFPIFFFYLLFTPLLMILCCKRGVLCSLSRKISRLILIRNHIK